MQVCLAAKSLCWTFLHAAVQQEINQLQEAEKDSLTHSSTCEGAAHTRRRAEISKPFKDAHLFCKRCLCEMPEWDDGTGH